MDVEHSCRCCLRRAPDKDLTTPYTHLGTTEIYSDMLKECFEIHLILDSEDKVGICDVCVGRLRDASEFKLQVQRSQAELQARLQGALQVKEEKPAVESLMEWSGMDGDRTSEEPVWCKEPLAKTETEDEEGTSDKEGQELSVIWPGIADLEDPTDRAREQLAMACSVRLERLRGDEAPHASQACPATSRHGPGLASRMKDMPDDTAGLRAEEQAYTCDTCGEHFTDKSRLIEHIQAHSTQADELCGTYSCKTRSKEFSCINIYTKHVYTQTKETYTCVICSAEFGTKGNLIRHIGTHEGKKRYPCEICNKTFVNNTGLKQHIMIHTGKKPFSCAECKKQFRQQYHLIRHERIHTAIKPYRCIECHKQFRCKQNLDAHKIIHTGEKPYSCKECNKQFAHRPSLYIHNKMHTGEKPYGCNECNKQFIQKSHLNEHKKIHTGERQYGCINCNKRFTQKRHLEEHKIIHTGEKHRCIECNKQFTRKRYLAAHKRIHTGETPYSCKECGEQFTHLKSLYRHNKIHTGEKP